jgi:parallel beta-helix repeat protein
MKKIGGVIVLAFLISTLTVVPPASAGTAHVYSGGSIQTAVDGASSGDTIYVHAGTYNENLTITKDLSLIGDGMSVTTIDGSTPSPLTHAITVDGAVVNISGFTITEAVDGVRYTDGASGTIADNTISGYGHGIYNHSSSPTITNNTIQSGIYNFSQSSPMITANTITGCTRGIYNHSSSPTITNNTITGNEYGIYNHSSSPTITNNTITVTDYDTHGVEYGIYNELNSSPTITNNTITESPYMLGVTYGIYSDSSSPTITNNTITENFYGIYNFISSPTITNNMITQSDYGIYNYSSSPTITNNTITGKGGNFGIYNESSSPTITNNIVVLHGVGIRGSSFFEAICTYNDVWGNDGADYLNVTPGVGSISLDPRLDGTYHLAGSSPCIDAGTDAGVYTDMDGDTRPVGTDFDIGADEYTYPINPIVIFLPVKNYHLKELDAYLGYITNNLRDEVPYDIQVLLDEIQRHIGNANTTGNTIYANNELLKALRCCDKIAEKLGIPSP